MEGVDCRALYERFDTDKNDRLSSAEFISMIEALLVRRDGVHEPAAALALASSLAKSKLFARASGKNEIIYDEFAEAIRGGLFAAHFSPELIAHVSGVAGRAGGGPGPDEDEALALVWVAPSLSQIRQDVVTALSRSNSRKMAASAAAAPVLAGGGAGGVEAEDETDGQPVVSSPRSAAHRKEVQCQICFDPFPPHELYGGLGNQYPKDCTCRAKCCIDCLQAGAKISIRAGQAPECPGRDPETGNACHASLRKALTAQFFVGECVLCNDPGPKNPLVAVDCALEHAFCKSCLARETRARLGPHSATVPRCPRFAECRYVFDKAAAQKALEGSCSAADMTALLDTFDSVRIRAALADAELNKPCSKPGCLGVLAGTRAFYERPEGVRVQCSACHDSFCYNCEKPFHHNRTCAQVREATMNWTRFLQELVQGGAAQGADGEGLGAVDPGAAAAALAAATNALATAAFFKEAIEQGRLKKCPGCKKQIEKIDGCDHMKCGSDAHGGNQQAGCGLDFSWSSVPLMSVADYDAEINAARQVKLLINSTDYQIDENSYSAIQPPRQIACSRCQAPIRGTRFDCTQCASPGREVSLCLSCVQFHLDPAKKTKHAGHVFALVDPAPRPRPAIQLTRAELAPDGSLSVYGLQSCVERLTREEPYNSPYQGYRDSNLPDHWSTTYHTSVRVDVYPDGRVVYADATGLACEHICLDSISFKVAGKGIVHNLPLADSAACGPAGGGFRDPVMYKSSNGVTLAYGHVALLARPVEDPLPPLVKSMLNQTVRLTAVVHNSPIYAAYNDLDKDRKFVLALKPDAAAPQNNAFSDWHVVPVEDQPKQIRLWSRHYGQYLYVADGNGDRKNVLCWRRGKNAHADILSKARLEVEEVPGSPGVVRLRSAHHAGRPYIYTTLGDFDKRRRRVMAWCGAAGANADVLARAQMTIEIRPQQWGGAAMVPPPTLGRQVVANTSSAGVPFAHKTMIAVVYRLDKVDSGAGAGAGAAAAAAGAAGAACAVGAAAGGGISPATMPRLGVSLNHCVFKSRATNGSTPLTLGGGVTAVAGAKHRSVARLVVSGEMVFLYGLLNMPVCYDHIVLARLPEGARPAGALQLTAIGDFGEDDGRQCIVKIGVLPSGEVVLFSGHGEIVKRVALDSVRFKIGAPSVELDVPSGVDQQRHGESPSFWDGQGGDGQGVQVVSSPWARAGLHLEQHCCHLLGAVFKRRPAPSQIEGEEDEVAPLAPAAPAAPAGGGMFGGFHFGGQHQHIGLIGQEGGVWRHGDVICVLPEGARPTAKMVFSCLTKACPM